MRNLLLFSFEVPKSNEHENENENFFYFIIFLLFVNVINFSSKFSSPSPIFGVEEKGRKYCDGFKFNYGNE